MERHPAEGPRGPEVGASRLSIVIECLAVAHADPASVRSVRHYDATDRSCTRDQTGMLADAQPQFLTDVDIGTHWIAVGFHVDVPMPALATIQTADEFRGADTMDSS